MKQFGLFVFTLFAAILVALIMWFNLVYLEDHDDSDPRIDFEHLYTQPLHKMIGDD